MNPTATLSLCKWLKDRIRDWENEAKQQLELLPGERKAAVVDGHVLGHVSMAKGRKTAKVVDHDALLAFVRDHYPTEIEVTEQVVEGEPYPINKLANDADSVIAGLLRRGALGVDGLIAIEGGGTWAP